MYPPKRSPAPLGSTPPAVSSSPPARHRADWRRTASMPRRVRCRHWQPMPWASDPRRGWWLAPAISRAQRRLMHRRGMEERMTRKDFAIFDGDSHAVEPPELWEKYLEPEDRTLGKHGLWRQEAGSPEPGAGAPAHSPKPSPRGGSSGFPGSRAPGSGFSS